MYMYHMSGITGGGAKEYRGKVPLPGIEPYIHYKYRGKVPPLPGIEPYIHYKAKEYRGKVSPPPWDRTLHTL